MACIYKHISSSQQPWVRDCHYLHVYKGEETEVREVETLFGIRHQWVINDGPEQTHLGNLAPESELLTTTPCGHLTLRHQWPKSGAKEFALELAGMWLIWRLSPECMLTQVFLSQGAQGSFQRLVSQMYLFERRREDISPFFYMQMLLVGLIYHLVFKTSHKHCLPVIRHPVPTLWTKFQFLYWFHH